MHHKVEASLQEQGITYTKISTRPAPFNTVLWNINVDTQYAYLIGDYSFFDSQPIVYKMFPKKRAQAQKWIETDEVQRLITISEGWYILEKEEESWVYNDLRFGLISNDDNDSQFVFRYLLTENDGTITATEDRPKPENGKKLLIDLWERLKGN